MSKQKVFLLVLFTLIGFNSLSQDYKRVDSIAISLKDKRYRDVKSLVHDLTKDLTKEEDKYRAFYTYMINSFSYSFSNSSIKSTLKSKKGACSSLSNLYKEMCDISGLKCDVVVGYVRDPYMRLNVFDFIFNRTTHAWNIIELDGAKTIIDVTWGLATPTLAGTRKITEDEPLYFFFNPSKEIFSYSHYAKNRKKRFVKQSSSSFMKKVLIYRPFYKICDSIIDFPIKLKQRGKQLDITIKNDLNPQYFSIHPLNSKEVIRPDILDRNNNLNTITLRFNISKIGKNNDFYIAYNIKDIYQPRPLLHYQKK